MSDIICEVSFHRLSPEWEAALANFFATLTAAGDDHTFHPHTLDSTVAHRLASYVGRDEYHIAVHKGAIIAYGILRGWDDGYETPSLGIAVCPAWRRRSIGRRMMEHLHQIARGGGTKHIRLKVYPDNIAALSLYKDLGYRFGCSEQGQRVGVLKL